MSNNKGAVKMRMKQMRKDLKSGVNALKFDPILRNKNNKNNNDNTNPSSHNITNNYDLDDFNNRMDSSTLESGGRNNMDNGIMHDMFRVDKKGRTRILVEDKEIKVKKFRISNAYDADAVGDLVCRVTPTCRVDSRSIGGVLHNAANGNTDDNNNSIPLINECLMSFRVTDFEWNTDIPQNKLANAKNLKKAKKQLLQNKKAKNKLRYICMIRSTNRPLRSRHQKVFIKGQNSSKGGGDGGGDNGSDNGSNNNSDYDEDDIISRGDYSDADDANSHQSFDELHAHPHHPSSNVLLSASADEDIYDSFYNPEYEGPNHPTSSSGGGGGGGADHKKNHRSNRSNHNSRYAQRNYTEKSSFPSLVSLVLYQDGTHPEIRKSCELDQLVSVQVLNNNNNSSNNNNNNNSLVQLAFASGESVEIELLPSLPKHAMTNDRSNNNNSNNNNTSNTSNTKNDNPLLAKQFFLWSLLQVHAILCTSVVDQLFTTSRGTGTNTTRTAAMLTPLPTLTIRNIDRADLQYVSTVNGFLSDSPFIAALLEKQRNQSLLPSSNNNNSNHSKTIRKSSRQNNDGTDDNDNDGKGGDGDNNNGDLDNDNNSKVKLLDDMDGMAWDMMMGNYGMRNATIFLSEDEKKDAEEVLNGMPWREPMEPHLHNNRNNNTEHTPNDNNNNNNNNNNTNPDESNNNSNNNNDNNNYGMAVSQVLTNMLEKRMRDLEAETCRRLISWEDEKYFSLTGVAAHKRDTADALSLAHLFKMLDKLDQELGSMEDWLDDKVKAIQPLTDDCRGIEEENRQLEQQWKSYDMLGAELKRLLSGLDVPQDLFVVIRKPESALKFDALGRVDLEASERGINQINEAGIVLKEAQDKVRQEGGMHLKAVSERTKELADLADGFSRSLAKIVITVMDKLSAENVNKADFKHDAKNSNHTEIAKIIRDTQRKFQTSLLAYMKIIEVIQLLRPSLLTTIRESYSDLVSEGILSKKRLKIYFHSLPGKSTVHTSNLTLDLSQYNSVGLNYNKKSQEKSSIQDGDLNKGSHHHHTLNSSPNMPNIPGKTNVEKVINNMKSENAQDIQLALAEILPIVAREAYFTAALFGMGSKQLDGREKKRNFDAAKKSVDHSSQYFRYYISRICGVGSDPEGKRLNGDAMLSLVASIHLNEALDSYIDRQKKGGDHSLSLAYVRATILDLRKKVDRQWVSWVEDQIKWIKTNHNVPLNGKRAGIITSFAKFPSYLDHIMVCCKAARAETYVPKLSTIKVTTYYLQKMAGALFASLQECAERDSTDQQYAANVMRMENSYYFTQSIKKRGPELITLFTKQITAASSICKTSTDSYLGWMIKREFKALHTLFSNISRIRRDVGDADVPIHVPRSTFVKTLLKESNREVMKEKIQTIYGRMEKHLSEAGGLLPVAWKALVKVLYEWFGRWEKLSTQCYKHVLDPSAVDVVRIAKAAGGVGMVRTNHKPSHISTTLTQEGSGKVFKGRDRGAIFKRGANHMANANHGSDANRNRNIEEF